MRPELTIKASAFKATCLEIFDRLAARKLTRVTVTKRGRPVAVLTPPDDAGTATNLFGFMAGTVVVPEGVDVSAPILEEPLNANRGRIRE